MSDKRKSSFPSRRQFLRTSTAAVGAGLLLRERLTRSAYAGATDETLRVGLVGCGGRGRGAAVQALTADPTGFD